jgi:hypothetical protein
MQPYIFPRGAWLWDWGPWSQRSTVKGLGGVGTHFPVSCIYIIVGPSVPSDCGLGARRWSEPSSQKLLRNPTPEHVPESAPDSVDTIALSLCGGLADSGDISLGMFDHDLAMGQGRAGKTLEGGAAEA